MNSYDAAARDYETWLDRQMDEEMEAEYNEEDQCDHDDYYDTLEAERRMER